MKKIINQPETLVEEMCCGMAAAHPELEVLRKYKIIKKKTMNPQKVSLISGGGSGHEPAHGGFVGQGMLDAAVCGDVFASPSQIQVYQAIKATAGEKGTLLIIKNYSGDMMNFKNGAHLAEEDGIQVEYVKVDDDIAVKDSLYTVGRRGVAGTVLVHKIAGAAAEKGYSLKKVKAAAENAIANIRSIGFALTSCTVPAKGTPTFYIKEDEMEYGVGIHGEPGIQREKIPSADELAERMVRALLEELDVQEQDEVTVLINGFGGTPLQELYLLNHSVTKELDKRNVKIYREFVGNYMTSIDMAGASISIMKMNHELKELLDENCQTPAFHVNGPVPCSTFLPLPDTVKDEKRDVFQISTEPAYAEIGKETITLENIIYMTDVMSDCIIRNEVPFCELDSHAGDGDFGMSVAKGFKQLKREWNEILEEHGSSIGEFLDACSMVIMEHCGGASGPIWGSAFRMAGKQAGKKRELSKREFADMLEAAVTGIQKTGEYSFGRGAVVGDKTLIDALVPSVDSWEMQIEQNQDMKTLFEMAAEAAVRGAKSTEEIAARMGRAGTVGDRSIGYPDAGAHALGVIFTEISQALIFT